MRSKDSVYVVGADVLMDYPGIIQLDDQRPVEPTLDLDKAHLVVPLAAVRKISGFTDGGDNCSEARRRLLELLRDLAEKADAASMQHVYRLQASMKISESEQIVSLMPAHLEVIQSSPFYLSDDDINDQIIVAAVATGLALANSNTNMEIRYTELRGKTFGNVILLTNDDGLAIRAHCYGLSTGRYKYKNLVSPKYSSVKTSLVPSLE